MEEKILYLARNLGIGAQFGGKYFLHDVRVLRLPRHGASCPVGIGVSCSADRQMRVEIKSKSRAILLKDGLWIRRSRVKTREIFHLPPRIRRDLT